MTRRALGAASDDPVAIARRALDEATEAIRSKDALGLRQAANKSYLAVASAADVAAAHMGMKAPGGTSGRRAVLEQLETRAKLKRGRLLVPFESTRAVLHGECFHGDDCPSPRAIMGFIDDAQIMAADTVAALAKLKAKRR